MNQAMSRRRVISAVTFGLVGGLIGAGVLALAPGLRASLSRTMPGPAEYANPVIGTDFADPTVLRATDDWYYAYSTEQLTVERMANIQAARSRDLVHWELLPDALPKKPAWAATTRDFWAPGAIEAGGRTYLYFAALHDSRLGMCLGVAVADAPSGPFTPEPKPLRCDGGGFVNIDPMPFDDPATGTPYLYWGSAGSPILVQALAADRVSFAPDSDPIEVLSPDADAPYEELVEAPWVVEREGSYYLFYSGDLCCDPYEPEYAVMVARSTSPTGPFERRSGNHVLLEASDRWLGPGHNAIVTDAAGGDWIVYHAIDPAQRFQPAIDAVRRPMLIDRLVWAGGWPEMAEEAPTTSPQRAPVARGP